MWVAGDVYIYIYIVMSGGPMAPEGPRSLRLHTAYWQKMSHARGHHFIVLLSKDLLSDNKHEFYLRGVRILRGPRSLCLHTAYWQKMSHAWGHHFIVLLSKDLLSDNKHEFYLRGVRILRGPRSLCLHTAYWQIILNAQGHHFVAFFVQGSAQ
jgi:hypothetical protein